MIKKRNRIHRHKGGVAIPANGVSFYDCFKGRDVYHYEIKKVIFNNPATIVWFADGDKVVVKCNNEEFDEEKGLSMAIVKKLYTRNQFIKWLPKEVQRRFKNEDIKI